MPSDEPVTVTLEGQSEPVDPRVLLRRMTASIRHAIGSVSPRTNRLKPDVLEAIYRQEPLLQRGILKHSGDAVKHGFFLVDADGEEHARSAEFIAWAKRTRVLPKLRQSLVSAHVYGDGLVELEYDDGGASMDPVPDFIAPVNVHVVDPTHCHFQPYRDEETGEVRFMLVQRSPTDTVTLHPDRFDHLKLKGVPGQVGGLSTVETAYHSALSKVKGDQGIGEILYHSGTPLRHGRIDNASADEVDAVFQMLNDPDFQYALAWDSRLVIDQLNPQAVDPTPYYEVMKRSIAAAIGIPVMMLEGAQAGAVVGSETNLTDYHSDLAEVQENVLGPVIERVASRVLGLDVEEFDVQWHPFPSNPESEAAAIRDKSAAWQTLVAGGWDPLAAARVAGIEATEDDFQQEPGLLTPQGQRPRTTPPADDAADDAAAGGDA